MADEMDDEELANADIAAFMPTNDELMDEQVTFSLSDTLAKLSVRRESRDQVNRDEYDEEELDIIPPRNANSNHEGGGDNQYQEEEEEEEELHIIKPNEGNQHVQNEDGEDEYDDDYHDQTADEDYDHQGNHVGEAALEKPTGKQHIYQHEAARPKFSVGKQKLSVAQAQLFGLLDKDGNLKLPSNAPARDQKQMMEGVNKLSKPREDVSEDINEEEKKEMTFQPKRSASALAAMKNKRCGYDFMDRLNSQGGFLDRLEPDIEKKKKIPKSELDAMQQDYEARLDKLQCPKCLKNQSFDEYFEKRRICTFCNVKFEKLNISSGTSFLKKMKEKEEARLEKMRKIEEEMYGSCGKTKLVKSNLAPSHSSSNKNKENTTLPPIAPKAAATNTNPAPPTIFTAPAVNSSSVGVDKMVNLHNNQAAKLNQVLENISQNTDIHVAKPSISDRKQRTSSAPAQRKVKNPIEEKMQKLVQS
jgi:hypothetical protein